MVDAIDSVGDDAALFSVALDRLDGGGDGQNEVNDV